MRYDTVFLDVDGTILWVNFDLEGYVKDVSPYARNGELTVENAAEPVWDGLREHMNHNVHYPTEEELEGFKVRNAAVTARKLEVDASPEMLVRVTDERLSFNPYPESESVLQELKDMGLTLCVVSNWDAQLELVLEGLGWTGYFDAVVASAKVGVEKPEAEIFETALEVCGAERGRTVHVGNDPVSDVAGAAACGIDRVLVSRKGEEVPEAVAVIPDLRPLPGLLRE
jgi:putative hydrolase of the HAD superfamily